MAKAVIATLFKVEGTSEEIAELAAEIDQRFKENMDIEADFHGVDRDELKNTYLGTFITQAVVGKRA